MSDTQTRNPKQQRKQKWDMRYAATDLVWSAGPNALFAEQVQDLVPGTALDVGCGEGRNALWLAEQGWRVTGIDFSSVAIDKARHIESKIGPANRAPIHWLADDVSSTVLPPQSFDLVAVLYLHTDPAEREQWLSNVAAALQPGGTFIYIGHDPSNIEHGVGGPQDPQFLPSAEDIAVFLQGFEIEFADVVERPIDADPGHAATSGAPGGTPTDARIALDTLVRARKPADE